MKTTKLFQYSAFNSLLDFKTKKNKYKRNTQMGLCTTWSVAFFLIIIIIWDPVHIRLFCFLHGLQWHSHKGIQFINILKCYLENIMISGAPAPNMSRITGLMTQWGKGGVSLALWHLLLTGLPWMVNWLLPFNAPATLRPPEGQGWYSILSNSLMTVPARNRGTALAWC